MIKEQTPGICLKRSIYGKVDGKDIVEYIITNPSGMQASIINYGGAVTSLIIPDRAGNKADVILGYDSLAGYLQTENPYVGCLIGRYGNRIANAKFRLDGEEYTLAPNNNGQSLHGGNKGFDKVIWEVEELADGSGIKLTYFSKDGEEGYPGNLTLTVLYKLNFDNSLEITYSAFSDKATPINLTNHCYFNLSAGTDQTILDHELQINADRFTEVDEVMIPTGKLPYVHNTAMDFTSPKKVGEDIKMIKGGYDHNWVVNKKEKLDLAASLHHPASGRFMEVYTTKPGIQFYSGNFLDGTLKHTKNNSTYIMHSGLCLETQHFPDGPNQPSFPDTILRPGDIYNHTTLYKFSIKE